MKTLNKIIGIELPKILLLDIGAMETNEPGRFESLYKNNLLKIIGFEANKDEYLKLKNIKNKKYLNYCLGDGSVRTLYVTNFPFFSVLQGSKHEIGLNFLAGSN